jgi:Tol biopolymer transport system component
MRVTACLFAVLGVFVVPGAASSRALPSCPCRPVADLDPVWSPDDRAIAYESTEGPPAVFTLAGRRTSEVSVPPNTSLLSFSPDWKLVAGVSLRQQLVVFRPDGTGVRPLDEILVGPTWAPDGEQLAYAKREGETSSLYTIRADGSDRHRIAVAAGGTALAWSPDSTQVAFAQGGQLVVARSDGGDVRRIAVADGFVYAVPAWSPDGGRIAVIVGDSLRPTIAIVALDGAPTLHVEPPTAISLTTVMSWSPGGARVLYSESNASNSSYGAYEIDLASGAQRRLALFGRDASYSHDGMELVFGGLTSIKDPPPVPTCVGVGIWVVSSSGGRPTRITSRCNNPPFTISIAAPRQLVYGERGQLTGSLLPGFGGFVRGSARPCGGKPSTLVTAAVDAFWSRPIAPHVTTVYTAESDLERTSATTAVSPRVTLKQTRANLTFEVKVLAARPLVGAAVRISVGQRVKRVRLQSATRRGASVTTSASFRLARSEVRPWLESLSAVVPARRCLAAGLSNELAVSRP